MLYNCMPTTFRFFPILAEPRLPKPGRPFISSPDASSKDARIGCLEQLISFLPDFQTITKHHIT